MAAHRSRLIATQMSAYNQPGRVRSDHTRQLCANRLTFVVLAQTAERRRRPADSNDIVQLLTIEHNYFGSKRLAIYWPS